MSEATHQKFIITVEIVKPEERDKFNALSRPETYHRVRPHEAIGERGCYTVEMTPEEYERARADMDNPESNLIDIEEPQRIEPHSVPNAANLQYAGLRDLVNRGYTASGVVVGVLDDGLSTTLRDTVFSGRVTAAEDFTPDGDPYFTGPPHHGGQIAGLAVPPAASLAVGKVYRQGVYGDQADAAEGLYWMADTANADVVNMSFGMTPGTALSDAVEYAFSQGVLLMASAGNGGNTTPVYPGAYPDVLCISNYDHRTDAKAPSSTYGTQVFAAAGGCDHTVYGPDASELHAEDGGTSAACAMATRIASYILGTGKTAAQTKTQMADTARSTGASALYEGNGVLELVGAAIPLPTVPPGETRDFDLTLPELPGWGETGSSGTDCEQELNALVDALAASPTPINQNELIGFIEAQTGEDFDVLVPEWDQVALDGVSREATVEVCGVSVHLVISGEFTSTRKCAISTYTLDLNQNDFTLEPTQEFVFDPDDTFWQAYTTLPTSEVHLQDPRLEYLAIGDDDEIIARTHGLGTNSVPYGGIDYIPTYRINGTYTTTLAIFHQHQEANPFFPADTDNYEIIMPPFGFHLVRRLPSGSVGGLTVDDPLRLGTILAGQISTASTDYPRATDRTAAGNDDDWWLPPVPDASPFTPSIELGDTTLAGLQAEVDQYNAERSIYDPVLTLDTVARTATATFMTRENALRIEASGCEATIADADTPYDAITVVWGGYYGNGASPAIRTNSVFVFGETDWLEGLLERVIRDDDDRSGVANTNYRRALPYPAGSYIPSLAADVGDEGPAGGEPPDTTTNPPLTPAGGGCRSSLFGPASCNWAVPVPASPQPEAPDFDTPDFPMPKDNFPDVPVVRTHLPNLPSLPCTVPDFGNMDPCGKGGSSGKHPNGGRGRGGGGGPGYMGPTPGGRDWQGNRGSAGTIAGVKTAGQTYAARDYLFTQTTCPGQITPGIGSMAVITQLLMDCGINPIDIIFQVGPESDKIFPSDKCFPVGSRIFDAAAWSASFLMLTIVDEGEPTNDVYIGPPWHRPLQSTWTFDEHYDLLGVTRNFSSEGAYGWVEVFGPNVITPVIVRVEDPFSTEDSPTLRLEVGANFTQADAEDFAAYRASFALRESVSVQATVPYSSEYFLRDLMLLQAPDRGFQESYVIVGKESDISAAGRFHILSGMLPATLAELDAFPEVTDEYSAVDGGFA